jgi:transposase InsO family protein
MNDRMKAQLVCDASKMAYWRRKPPPGLIIHSNRAVKYANREYRVFPAAYKMQQSMIRRANCWDNSVMESCFKTLKLNVCTTYSTHRIHMLGCISSTGWKGFTIRSSAFFDRF